MQVIFAFAPPFNNIWQISRRPAAAAFISGVSPPALYAFTFTAFDYSSSYTADPFPEMHAKCSGVLLKLSSWFKFGLHYKIAVSIFWFLAYSVASTSVMAHAKLKADIPVSVIEWSTGNSLLSTFYTSATFSRLILVLRTMAAFWINLLRSALLSTIYLFKL